MSKALTARAGAAHKLSASAGADGLALERQLCFALYSASLAMTKVYAPLLRPLGLTYSQYLVLLVLWETGEIGVSALGERLSLDSGTLTPLLKRLEADGLVTRRRAVKDERRVVIALTSSGRTLRKRALLVPPRVAEAAGCSLGELVELTRRLQDLRATLQAERS